MKKVPPKIYNSQRLHQAEKGTETPFKPFKPQGQGERKKERKQNSQN
jgi:hypothetical protein